MQLQFWMMFFVLNEGIIFSTIRFLDRSNSGTKNDIQNYFNLN